MNEFMQNFEKEKSGTTKDWIVYSELRQRVEDLIISSIEEKYGGPHTLQIIKTATSKSGQSQSEMFSDYENFARTIKDVFGKEGQVDILKRTGLKILNS